MITISPVFGWWANRQGTTAIEYGLIAAAISLAIVAVVFVVGDQLENFLTVVPEPLSDIPNQVETGRSS